MRSSIARLAWGATLACVASALLPLTAEAEPSSLLVAGAGGGVQIVPTTLAVPPRSIQVALSGQHAQAVAHAGGETLVVGNAGRVHRVGADGLPVGSSSVVLDGFAAFAVGRDSTGWLVGGDGGRIQRVSDSGVADGAVLTMLQGAPVRVTAFNGTHWLVAGDNGRFILLLPDLSPVGSTTVALGGNRIRAAAWNGTHWLVGGEGGRVQRITAAGVLDGSYTTALSSSIVRGVAALGSTWLVAGDSGRFQKVLATGVVDAASFQSTGQTWYSAAANGVDWMLVGAGGRSLRVAADGTAGTTYVGLDAVNALGVAWRGDHWLTVGEGGRVQRLDIQGKPIVPYATHLGGLAVLSAGFDGQDYLIGGEDYAQRIAADGSALAAYNALSPLFDLTWIDVRGVAFDGTNWMLAGEYGRWKLLSPSGATVASGNHSTYFNGVAAIPTGWIMVGDTGDVMRLNPLGQKIGSTVNLLASTRIRAVAANGERAVIVGDAGKARVISQNLTAVSPIRDVLNGLPGYAAGWNGETFLVGGDYGYVQRLSANGDVLGPARRALGDVVVRSITWIGDAWIVAGGNGQMRRVDATGEPVGGIAAALDGQHIYAMAADGGGLAAQSSCASSGACIDGLCTSGVCACPSGCAIDGECWADGEPRPSNPCLVCAVAISTTSWTPAPNGIACGAADACEGAGVCQQGACTAPVLVTCNSGGDCTQSTCNPASGECETTAVAGPCSDGDACTAGDTCAEGTCVPGAAVPCDDANPCTDDSCDAQTGACTHVPNASACSDGNPCTDGDTCAAGACAGAAVADGTACEVGQGCGSGGTCAAGACVAAGPEPGCGSLLVAGEFAAATVIPSDVSVVFDDVHVALGGYDVYALAASPSGTVLAVGDAGRGQLLASDGSPVGPVLSLLTGNDVQAVSWGGDRWLAVGYPNRAHFVMADGTPAASSFALPTYLDTQFASYNGASWLVGGRDGTTCLVHPNGTTTPSVVALGGGWAYAADWNGSEWLVGGASGRIQRIAADGTPIGTHEVALAGQRVRAIRWLGDRWLVMGDDGYLHHVDVLGRVITSSIRRVDTHAWWSVALGTSGALAVSSSGVMVPLGTDYSPSGPAVSALDGSAIYAVAWTGSTYVIGGATGRVRRRQVDASGAPVLPYRQVFGTGWVNGAAWNGVHWVVAGPGQVAVLDQTASTVAGPTNLSSSFDMFTAVHGNGQWLVGGDYGRYSIVAPDGTVAFNGVGESGTEIFAAGYSGQEFLIVGVAGYVRRISTTGTELGTVKSALSGADVRAVAWRDGGWLVAGGLGRIQRLAADGTPSGAYWGALDNLTIRAMATDGERFLIAGELGRVQLLDRHGAPAGPVRVALGGRTAYAAAFTGEEWVVAGTDGYIQRLDAQGVPIGAPQRTLDGFDIRELVYGGPPLAELAACVRSEECLGGTCAAGVCGCIGGCVIDGQCRASGEENPANPCQVCTPGASTSQWSARPNGTSCSADACYVAGPAQCQSGSCVGSTAALSCDDGNPCTADSCDDGQCSHAELGGQPCSDGDPCTSGELCAGAQCQAGTPVACSDGNPCTDDSCNSGSGACEHAHNALPCDDGNPCTSGESCAAGTCAPGAAVQDGSPCGTSGTCSASNACIDGACAPGPALPGCGPTLAGGDAGRVQLVPADVSVPQSSVRVLLDGDGVLSISRGDGDVWLVGSADGAVQLIGPEANPLTTPVAVLTGWEADFASWGDGVWLVGGRFGYVRRIGTDGLGIGAYTQMLGGERAFACAYIGPHWLIAGESGRAQRVSSSGQPDGAYFAIMPDGSIVSALSFNGTHALAISATGWSRLLDGMGAPAADPRPVLGGGAARDVVWLEDKWLVVGDAGRYQFVDAAGTPIADSLRILGTEDWDQVARDGDRILLGGSAGAVAALDSSGQPVGSTSVALNGGWVGGIAGIDGAFLVVGQSGRAQRVEVNAQPAVPYQSVLGGATMRAAGWTPSRWLTGGGNYAQLLGLDLAPLTAGIADGTALSGFAVNVVAPGPSGYLVAGASGRIAYYGTNGQRVGSVASIGSDYYGGAYNGGVWLLCGATGLCRPFNSTPAAVASAVTTLGGSAVRAVVASGTGWLVGGDGGKVQVVTSAGAVGGAVQTVLGTTIRALASDGHLWLAAGDGGAYRFLAADGSPLGSQQTALDGANLLSAEWTGVSWVLGAAGGRAIRLSPTGQPEGSPVTLLDGYDVRFLTVGGPARDPGAACSLSAQCRSGMCAAGTCTADCTMGGVGYVAGERHPANSCLACIPSSSTVAWTARESGFLCEDGDKCTVGDTCDAGVCLPGSPLVCDDGDPCTAEHCQATDGSCAAIYVGGAGCPTGVLLAGAKGATALTNAALEMPPPSYATLLAGNAIRAMARLDEGALLVGDGGLVQVVDAARQPVGPPAVALGAAALAAKRLGTTVLVAGVGGRTRLLDLAGQPLGPERIALTGSEVRAIESLGTGFIVGGANGRVQLVDASGMPVGAVVQLADGHDVNALSFNGTHVLVAANWGRVQLLLSDLTLASPVLTDKVGGWSVLTADWDGARWLVTGITARTELLGLDGATIPGSSQDYGDDFRAAAAGGGGWLVAGDLGEVFKLGPDGIATRPLATGLAGATVRSALWMDTHWWIAGDLGRLQEVDASGAPVVPFATLLQGRDLAFAAWNGQQWLVGADELVQRVALDGTPVGAPISLMPSGQTVQAADWDGQRWLVVGTAGYAARLAPPAAATPPVVWGPGSNLLAVKFDGASWLVAGTGGFAQRFDTAGSAVGPALSLFDGQDVLALGSSGDGWLAAGRQGRVQRIAADGQPGGPVRYHALNLDILALDFSGSSYLVGAASGHVQLLDASGEALGPPMAVLEGVDVRTVAWVGDGWLVGGAGGRTRKLDPLGSPAGPVYMAIDGLQVQALSFGGAPRSAGAACTLGSQCPTGQCAEGRCTCPSGCAIAAACVPPGAVNPANPCETCQAAVDPVGWTQVANGTPCDAAGACADGGTCVDGACDQVVPDCSDGNACTADACNPETGQCEHQALDAGACDDSNPCTTGDACASGGCAGGAPLDCDDGNPCTDDSCHATLGCLHDPNVASCDDDNPCTGDGECAFGACTPGLAVADGTGCGDPAEPCTSGDSCVSGVCSPGPAQLGCAKLLLAGQSGVAMVVSTTLTEPELVPQTLLAGADIFAAVAGASHVLLAGASGRAQLVGFDGLAAAASQTMLSGVSIRAGVWLGDRWLVAGDGGRIGLVDSQGLPIGSYLTSLGTSAVRAVALGDGALLVGGDSGRYQKVGLNGVPVGTYQTLPGASPIRAIAWTGQRWVMGTDDGQLWGMSDLDATATWIGPVLGGRGVRAMSWTQHGGLVAGVEGRAVRFDALGAVDEGSFVQLGAEITHVGGGADGWVTLATNGSFAFIPAMAGSPPAARLALGGQPGGGAPWTGAGFLLVGRDGFTQRLRPSGEPVVPYLQAPMKEDIAAAAFNGDGFFFVAGQEGVRTDQALGVSFEVDPVLASAGYTSRIAFAASWNGQMWLAGGEAGRYRRIDDAGNAASYQTAGNGLSTIYGAAWSGEAWLLVGTGGITCRANGLGAVLGCQTALGGKTAVSVVWTGDHWLVGGVEGRVQRVVADGTPTGPVHLAVQNFPVRALSLGGTGVLAVGDSGYVQLLEVDGTPVGVAQDLLGSKHGRSAAWLGDTWLAVGDSGAMRRIGPDGTAVGGLLTGLYGLHVNAVSYAGPSQGAGEPCVFHHDCLSGGCGDGECQPDCVIEGVAYLHGAHDPTNPCQVCDVNQGDTEWTPLATGEPCADGDACTVGDACDAGGACVPGTPVDCDDGISCTVDACDSESGACSHDSTGKPTCLTCGNGQLDVYAMAEGFELGSLQAQGFAAQGWALTSNYAHDGAVGVASTNYGDNTTATLTRSVTTAAGNLCFWARGSSQGCCDRFSFRIDGALKLDTSNIDWTQFCYPVTAGAHTLEWRYSKNQSQTAGEDSYVVDGVSLPSLEVCDDGNTASGDDCSGDCRSLEVCGNRIVDLDETCDLPPSTPVVDLTAIPLAGGMVQLAWTPLPEPGLLYALWRDDAPITQIEGMGPAAITTTGAYLDTPPYDGPWHYTVTAYRAPTHHGPLGNLAQATSDGTGPAATLSLSTPSPVGEGSHGVTLTSSEPLAELPVLWWTSDGALPVYPLVVQPTADPRVFTASLELEKASPNGPATFHWSAEDAVGNAQLPLAAGAYFFIDTDAVEPPTALVVTASGADFLAVSWTASANSNGQLASYRVDVDGVPALTVPAGTTAATLLGLSPETVYALGVRAVEAGGYASPAAEATGVTWLAHPTGISASAHDRRIDLAWSPPPLLPYVSGYRIYVQTADFSSVQGLAPALTVGPGATTATVTGLTNGQTYFVAVTTVNVSNGEAPSVTTVSGTPADDTPPEAPSLLNVVAATDSTLSVSWTPSANTIGDLAGYRIYADGALVASAGPAATGQTITGLAPAAKIVVGISAFDTADNESAPKAVTGYTWMPNPAGVSIVEAKHQKLVVGWTPVAPAAHIQSYRVYVSTTPFSSITGMTPATTVAASSAQATVSNLVNGQTYFVAVTTRNKSSAENPSVTPVTGTPVADTVGPSITGLTYRGAAFTTGSTASKSGDFAVTATDAEGVASARFTLDGSTLLAFDTTPSNGLKAYLSLLEVADGPHALAVEVTDTVGNATVQTTPFTVALAAPDAPVLTKPADGSATNMELIVVEGTAEPQSTVAVYRGGALIAGAATADASGKFSKVLTIAAGDNVLTATASNRAGASSPSAPVHVELDLSVPAAPKGLTASAVLGGEVKLAWFAGDASDLDAVAGYRIWRAAAPFASTSEAVLLNPSSLVAGYAYTDLPPADGPWYYRVVTRNSAGTDSEPSALASASSDGTPPEVTALVVTPQGAYAGSRIGVGPVRVDVAFSEELLTTPFVSFAPEGGLPLTAGLTKTGTSSYSGTFSVLSTTPSGVAPVVVSARDLLGNRGTAVAQGQTSILVDTDAPSVAGLLLSPAAPIRNDVGAPVVVDVTVELAEAMAPGMLPELSYTLSLTAGTPVPLILQPQTPTIWTTSLTLSASAGNPPEVLAFQYFATDDLGNETDAIAGKSAFEVYQGALPPLPAPLNVAGSALPAGGARVTWAQVAGAAEYEVYRQDPGGTAFLPVGRTSDPEWTEVPGPDGSYLYAIASIRHANGQETASGLSLAVIIATDSVAPGAPSGLQLQLASNGVALSWLAPSPVTEPVTYSVYRSAGAEIADLTGLAALITGLGGTVVVDPTPSASEHAYAVAAVDAAGNASLPSNSAYLNAGLLPVQNLSITADMTAGTPPELCWAHPASDLSGFAVTVDGVPAGTAPPGSPTCTAVSSSWDPAVPATHTYGVLAVDVHDAESLERFVALPAIDFEPSPPPELSVGVLCPTTYRVRSSSALAGARLVVTLDGKEHPSAPFSALPEQEVEVPVVLGGYASLGSQATLHARVDMTTSTGESLKVLRQATVPVGQDVYAANILAPDLVQDAVAAVQFAFHNPRSVPVELVTAVGAGTQPSPDIRILLTDLDGNVLSSAPFFQALGEGVVNVAGGITVARIPAGSSYTSAPLLLGVPANAPEQVRLVLELDHVHYGVGKFDHVEIQGFSTTLEASTASPPYDPVVQSALPAVSVDGAPVTLAGAVLSTSTGEPVAGVPVDLAISLNGFVRTFKVYSDASGAFSYAFAPLPNEGGLYQAWANYPGSHASLPEVTFVVQRVLVAPSTIEVSLAAGYTTTVAISVTTLPGTPLTNVRIEPGVLASGISLELAAPQHIGAGEQRSLPVSILATSLAPQQGQFFLDVVSDEGEWASVPVQYVLTEAAPQLVVKPTWLETGVARGDAVTEQLVVSNEGLARFEALSFRLMNKTKSAPAPSWAFITSGQNPTVLDVDGSTVVSMTMAPAATTPLSAFEPYTFWLQAVDHGTVVGEAPLFVWVDDSGSGGHLFKVSDIYTNTLDGQGQLILGVAGAKVKLDKLLGAPHSATLLADEAGEALFSSLPVGTYKYRVSASGHEAVEGNLTIKPGVVGISSVLLPVPLVVIEWEVTETTIADKYTVVLKATFETDVPAPVVVTEPTFVQLPYMKQGDVFYGEYTLTNYGLIRADSLTPHLPPPGEFKFELLVQPPPKLEAKESVTIPYRVIRLAAAEPEGQSSGGGCLPKGSAVTHCYAWICANGIGSSGCTGMGVASGNGGGGGGGGGCGPGGGSGGWPWGWGGAAGGGGPGCDPCQNPNASESDKQCCSTGKSQSTGSAVDLITGDYTDDATDLRIKILGYTVVMERYFAGREWSWRFVETDLDVVSAGGIVTGVEHLGITYAPDDEDGTVFRAGDQLVRIVDGDPEVAYRWEDAYGFWRTFDADGKLLEVGDSNDRVIGMVRGAQGALVGLSDTDGQQFVAFEYDGPRIAALQSYDGRRVEYTWAGSDLTQVTLPDGGVITYAYDAQHRMVAKTFPSGEQRFIAYASSDTVESVLDAAGQGSYFSYGYNSATQQNYAAILKTSGVLEEKWYDKSGALVQHTIDGAPVEQLASRGVLDFSEDGTSAVSIHEGGVKGMQWSLGDRGQLDQFRDERGVVTRYERDAAGNVLRMTVGHGRPDAQVFEYTYDGRGQMLTETHRGDGATPDAVIAQTYDAYGNVATRTLPGGRTYTYTWDAEGRQTSVADPLGNETQTTYDQQGRLLTRSLHPAGGGDPLVESWSYAPLTGDGGLVIGESMAYTDAEGTTASYEYDAAGRLVGGTDPAGARLTRAYDGQGRIIEERYGDAPVRSWEYASLGFGFARAVESRDGVAVRTVDADRLGRTVRVEADGYEVHVLYDGDFAEPAELVEPTQRLLFGYDPFGRLVTRTRMVAGQVDSVDTYDWFGGEWTAHTSPQGRARAVERHLGGAPDSYQLAAGVVEDYDLDAFGRLTLLRDPAGGPRVGLAYSPEGDLASREMGGALDVFSYDARGLLTEKTAADGTRLTYAYDALGHLTAEAYYASAEAETPDVEHSFAYTASGERTAAVSPEASIQAARDPAARTRSLSVDFGPFTRSMTYHYDTEDRVVGFTRPDGQRETYTYDAHGRLAGVALPGHGLVEVEYPDAWTSVATRPDGLVTTLVRDAERNPIAASAELGNGTTVAERTYVRQGRRIVQATSPEGTAAFAYDALDRLVAASSPVSSAETFTYDAAGNRATHSATGAEPWTYDAAQRLAAIGSSEAFTYDARGNMASRTSAGGTWAYEWDAADRLVRVLGPGGAEVAAYGYDALGRRVRKTVGGATTYFLWSNEGLIAEYDASGNELRAYGWMPTADWMDGLLWYRDAGAFAWAVDDGLGTTVALVDTDGDVRWQAHHRPFGQADIAPGSTLSFPLRASSQYEDAETGLHYNTFRYYAPALGRYLSLDPIREDSGTTLLYAFADEDPLHRPDRLGLASASGSLSGGDSPGYTAGVSFGGYAGLGGTVGGSAGINLKKCCVPKDGGGGQPVWGQVCTTYEVKAEGGLGVGGSFGIVGGSIKGPTAGLKFSCTICSGCGSGITKSCTLSATGSAGGVGGNVGPLNVDVGGPSIDVPIWSSDGPKAPTTKGPAVKPSIKGKF